jgi:hypothetical protein
VTNTRRITALSLTLSALTAVDAAAQGNGNKKAAKPVAAVERHGMVVVTTDDEAKIFGSNYPQEAARSSPGSRRTSPAGSRSPGLEQVPAPGDLVRRLPERPDTSGPWPMTSSF